MTLRQLLRLRRIMNRIPQQRLGQAIDNALCWNEHKGGERARLFHVPDDHLLDIMDAWTKEVTK